MGITIKEIAEKAGVSIGTVDRVLHNRGRFSEKTAKRINEICSEYGYVSNAVGRAMSMQRNENKIAVVINKKEINNFSFLIHEGVEDYACSVRDYNISFEFHDMKENSADELSSILSSLNPSDYKGIILRPIDDQSVNDNLLRFSGANIPIVTCSAEMKNIKAIAYVGQDHYKLGRMLGCTLSHVAKEEQHILIVVGMLNNTARKTKLEGFIDYLEERGKPYKIEKMVEVTSREYDIQEEIKQALADNPDINSIYIHVVDLIPCLDAIRDYKKFRGLVYSYGHPKFTQPYIKSGALDFAVYENPYEQGYKAGEAMFSYLLYGRVPENGKHIIGGFIAFDENC